jgi:RimJ/RimL family protein N-acetyltransferase
MTIKDFAAMVEDIKAARRIAQGPCYELSEKEAKSKVFRRSIFAVRDIEEGEIFSAENIRVIRPSGGLSPKYYEKVIGECSKRKIKRGDPISIVDIGCDDLDEGNPYSLRLANDCDLEIIFNWANDPITRRNSFNQEIIPFETHEKWFREVLDDPMQMLYIFEKKGEPIGQIRFSVRDNEAEISYSISPEKRGCGYGKAMIEAAKERIHRDFPAVKRIFGQVKTENRASAKCFEKNEFDLITNVYEYKYKE